MSGLSPTFSSNVLDYSPFSVVPFLLFHQRFVRWFARYWFIRNQSHHGLRFRLQACGRCRSYPTPFFALPCNALYLFQLQFPRHLSIIVAFLIGLRFEAL
eukprot:TRINITY_DN12590_c0_g1_i10.p7 TRINITY_DN12590_c0_g1~~TRINITY_DN12590_c0_g1_i10.p7  ORF type:complete len:100 (-),score=3.09 TRINITY_DN12590_c0_g1_i10:2304-2603(-)